MSDSQARSPARHLDLAGASNFRDLGGYRASDGRRVRWPPLFRSNHLGNRTDGDVVVLGGVGLKNPFGFRGTEQRSTAVCTLTGIAGHSLPIELPAGPARRAL